MIIKFNNNKISFGEDGSVSGDQLATKEELLATALAISQKADASAVASALSTAQTAANLASEASVAAGVLAEQLVTSLETKADIVDLNLHKENISNSHQVTKEQTGLKVQKGIIQFNDESQVNVLFAENYFTAAPEVPLTLIDTDSTPPVRINVSKDGMTVKTKAKFTGQIGWVATHII